MKSAQTWLSEYSESHQNPRNKKIHSICVPLIFWSTLAILWALPTPVYLQAYPCLNWGTLTLVIANIFYFSLGLRYGLPMFGISFFCCGICSCLQANSISLFWTGLIIFVPAWIGQFYGHKVEGKKPSFFKDLFYLFIGPLWVLEKLKSKPLKNQ